MHACLGMGVVPVEVTIEDVVVEDSSEPDTNFVGDV